MAGLGLIGWALVGGIGGAGEGMANSAIEEQKQEMLRQRDAVLARLQRETHAANAAVDSKNRTQEYSDRAKVDIDNIPVKGAAETAVAVDKRKAIDPLDLEQDAAKARQKNTIDDEDAPNKAKRAGLVSAATSNAELPAATARIRAAGEESRKTDKEGDERRASRDWKVDADGNYRRPDGSLVTEDVREGGKKLGERPVKAPRTKTEGGRTENYSAEDDIKYIERQIEALRKKDFRSPEEESELKAFESKREAKLGRKPQSDAKPDGATTFSGKYTKDGKRIMQDTKGNKFVEG